MSDSDGVQCIERRNIISFLCAICVPSRQKFARPVKTFTDSNADERRWRSGSQREIPHPAGERPIACQSLFLRDLICVYPRSSAVSRFMDFAQCPVTGIPLMNLSSARGIYAASAPAGKSSAKRHKCRAPGSATHSAHGVKRTTLPRFGRSTREVLFRRNLSRRTPSGRVSLSCISRISRFELVTCGSRNKKVGALK